MSVEIDLQSEGTPPRGKADAARSQPFVDEIEVVMQALAVMGTQAGLARGVDRARAWLLALLMC
jgi:hypothetical protein